MKVEIKIPAVGESISEATIAQWMKKDGEMVKRDDVLLTLETDKASVEVVAEQAGKLSTTANEGDTVPIGAVVGSIDTDAKGDAKAAAPAPEAKSVDRGQAGPKPSAPPKPFTPPPVPAKTGPAVQHMAFQTGIDPSTLTGTGPKGNVTKGDMLKAAQGGAAQTGVTAARAPQPQAAPAPKAPTPLPAHKSGAISEEQSRETMSRLRQTIAKRLVEAQHTAAILTTFNEIDMSHVMELRAKYKEDFKKRYGTSLGFMGLFVKASIEALKAYPRVNAFIDGNDILFNNFYNIGVAVGTEKGLMVPVIRHADHYSVSEVELAIKHYAEKARDGKISVDDLAGGTFTISNGGVYGSMMSTPILNPPQSGILGLHKIEERPVAINGKVEIRPMMYVALSYDHRMVDGKEAVSFLVKVKECMEDPARILLEI